MRMTQWIRRTRKPSEVLRSQKGMEENRERARRPRQEKGRGRRRCRGTRVGRRTLGQGKKSDAGARLEEKVYGKGEKEEVGR